MPKAAEHSTTFLSRRTLIRMAAIVPLATVPPALMAVPAVDPDAALLALGAEVAAVNRAIRAWPVTSDPDHLVVRLLALYDEIEATPAHTPRGLGTKIRIAFDRLSESIAEEDGPTADSDSRLVFLWDLIAEAEAMAWPAA